VTYARETRTFEVARTIAISEIPRKRRIRCIIAAGHVAFLSFFVLDGTSRRASRRRFLCRSTVVGLYRRYTIARGSSFYVRSSSRSARNIYGEDNGNEKERKREGGERESTISAAPSSLSSCYRTLLFA